MRTTDEGRHRLHWLSRVALTALVLGLGGCEGGTRLDLVPNELVGTWTTDAPGYDERALEIFEDGLVIWAEGVMIESRVLRTVRRWDRAGLASYRFEYLDSDGGLTDFEFDFRAADGLIRIRNQPDIAWRRTGPPSTDAIG
jgi:hypothetical protein